jgi:hypothetical protein
VDVDGDDLEDIIIGGNLFGVRPQVGRYDGLDGLILKNQGKAAFKAIPSTESGLKIRGEIRHIAKLTGGVKPAIAFIRNNNTLLLYHLSDNK